MPIPAVTIPAAVLASAFPTNADRTAGTFNSKAADWANSENAMATRTREIAEAARLNALTANQAANESNASATTAATQAGNSATSASAAAISATASASSAGTSSTQAGNAATSAATATTQASAATTQAGNAATSASAASASATTATTQATTATTQASNAAASASTATTQAAIATTQASTATNQAVAAGTSASAANTSAIAAASSANFRGAWSALTGALNVPASVLHNGQIWQLLTNQVNVALVVPGVSAAWYPVSNLDIASRAPIQPTLDLDFANQRYRMYDSAAGGLSSVALASILTYTGANCTFTDAMGVLRVQASNVPRLTFDPVTGAGNGLSVFEARTNLFLNSLVNGTSLATQSVTLGAGDHRLSFFGTGTVTITGTASGTLVGAGAYPTRSGLTFTATAGSVTFTVSGSVQFANLTTGIADTPFIPTAASAVTAPADVASLTGTNFSKWFNPVEGTFVAVFRRSDPVPAGVFPRVLDANDGTGAETAALLVQQSTNRSQFFVNSVSGLQANIVSQAAINLGASNAVAAHYRLNNFAISLNEAIAVTDTSGTVPILSTLSIGSSNTANHLNGTIQRILYFPRALPANLQQLSA